MVRVSITSPCLYLKRGLTFFGKEEKIFSLILSNFLYDIDGDTNIASLSGVTANRVCVVTVGQRRQSYLERQKLSRSQSTLGEGVFPL